jgi:DNA-binding PucR family transcriptional regulator
MLASEKLAIAAHLHVLLRRKTGRVTDTQWMADNAEYATEIVRFARQSAQEDGHVELVAWADKLEQAVLPTVAPRAKELRSADTSNMPTLRSLLASNASRTAAADAAADNARYVRGLR